MSVESTQPKVMAATRDANFVSNPNTTTPKRWHILREDGQPFCGTLAVMGDPEPAEDVFSGFRCKRPGCRERWPKDEERVPLESLGYSPKQMQELTERASSGQCHLSGSVYVLKTEALK